MAAQEDQFVAFVPCGSRRLARKASSAEIARAGEFSYAIQIRAAIVVAARGIQYPC